MLPKHFYDRLDLFSSAEIKRHPLEKVILKIKLLSKREKEYREKLKVENKLNLTKLVFHDPKTVLGRAI